MKSRVETPAAEVPRAVLTIAVATAIPSPSLEILPYWKNNNKKNTEQQYHTRHGNLKTQEPYNSSCEKFYVTLGLNHLKLLEFLSDIMKILGAVRKLRKHIFAHFWPSKYPK